MNWQRNHSCVGHFICAAIFLLLYAGKLTLGVVKIKHLATAQLDPVMLFLNLSLKVVNIISWCLFFIGLPTIFIQKGSAILKYFVELSYLIYLLNVLPLMIISDGFYKAEFSHVNICLLTIIIGFIVCVRL